MRNELAKAKPLLVSLSFVVCFLTIAVIRSGFYSINQHINLWSASVNTGFFTLPAETISIVFDTIPMAILSVIVATILLLFHHARYGILLLGSMGGTTLLVDFCKTVFQSPRPLNQIVSASGFSFPSGHTTSTVVFFGVLAYFALKQSGRVKVKAAIIAAYVSVTAVVGFDRIYLNVHWFSDVIGAVFLGGFWLSFCVFIFNRLISSRFQRFTKNKTLHNNVDPPSCNVGADFSI